MSYRNTAITLAALSFLAACSGDQLEEGFETLGGGVIVTAQEAPATITLYLHASDQDNHFERQGRYQLPVRPDGAERRYLISPDAPASHVLVADLASNIAAEDDEEEDDNSAMLRIFDTRGEGLRQLLGPSLREWVLDDLTTGNEGSRPDAEDNLSAVHLVDVWWSGDTSYVVKVGYTYDEQPTQNEILYRLSAVEEQVEPGLPAFDCPGTPDVSGPSCSAIVPAFQAPENAPPGFTPVTHRAQADDRLSLWEGEVLLDGDEVTGAESENTHVTGVIWRR